MNIAQMLAHGPTIKTQPTSKTAHLKPYSEQQSQARQAEFLAVFKGQQLTSKQIADVLGCKTPSHVAKQLRRMESRGVIRVAGHTKAGHQLRSKIIWEEVHAVKS